MDYISHLGCLTWSNPLGRGIYFQIDFCRQRSNKLVDLSKCNLDQNFHAPLRCDAGSLLCSTSQE